MTALRDLVRPAFRLAALLAICTFANAQQVDDLRQQLDQLKQEYQQKIQEMEKRIDDLEAQKSSASATPPASASVIDKDALAEEVKNDVKNAISGQAGKLQGQLPSEPTYDLVQEADTKIEKLEEEAKAFEFHGYFRSGYGLNGQGGQMTAFEAPGAGAKYRLGNEAETYGEFIFVNNWINAEHTPSKLWAKTEVMLEANTTNSNTYSNTDQFRLREAFVQLGNVFDNQPDAKFWVGERYYRRQHIEIDDFYPLDMSAYGGGVEDLNLKFAKASLALLGGARPDIVTNIGNYAKSNIDLRLYDIKAPMGTVGFWFDYARTQGATAANSSPVPSADGYAFGFKHQKLNWEGGYHIFSVEYGKGGASNFSTSIDDPTPFVKKSDRLLITEQVLFQPNNKFAIMPIAVFQRFKDGNPQHGFDDWASFGARPEWFFTEHLSLALEGGFDYVSSGQHLYDGWLRKVTIAPQIGAGRKFFSRPVLRAFLTYGNWSEGLRGFVGGIPFQNRKDGFTYGLQTETWW